MTDNGRIAVRLISIVKEVGKDKVVLEQERNSFEIANEEIGVKVETKLGTA